MREETMQRLSIAGLTGLALAATLLTGCASGTSCDDDDDSTVMVMFLGADGRYHYGSPTGSAVPDSKVPKSARTAPGYKAPAAPAPKVDTKKAPSAPKPAAPARPAGKR
jgi:hypothetical protein